MAKAVILGRKIGMDSVFDADGNYVPVTVIEAGPCRVLQVKTAEKDGYEALRLAFLEKKEPRTTKPQLGEFKKAGIPPHYHIREFRDVEGEFEVGQEIKVDAFQEGDIVQVSGHSKGRGFSGGMRRHGFQGAQITHGQSDRQRSPGSIGQSSDSSRVFKGMRMAGQHGTHRVTVKTLKVVKILPEKNLILIRGGVPGPPNGLLEVRTTVAAPAAAES